MSLQDFIKDIGGTVENSYPATPVDTHGSPLDGLLSAGWVESGDTDDGSACIYKHPDEPGNLITVNYNGGSWLHTYYDDNVASGAGAQDLRDHLAEWHAQETQLQNKKAWDLVRATEVVQKWVALTAEQQEEFKKTFQPDGEIGIATRVATLRFMKKAPPGWEGTVEAMKDHPEIDNPWSLAWSMYNEGDTSHKVSKSLVEQFCERTR